MIVVNQIVDGLAQVIWGDGADSEAAPVGRAFVLSQGQGVACVDPSIIEVGEGFIFSNGVEPSTHVVFWHDVYGGHRVYAPCSLKEDEAGNVTFEYTAMDGSTGVFRFEAFDDDSIVRRLRSLNEAPAALRSDPIATAYKVMMHGMHNTHSNGWG